LFEFVVVSKSVNIYFVNVATTNSANNSLTIIYNVKVASSSKFKQ